MTGCFEEIEDTRKDMYKVAKQMVKLKDSLITQKHLNQSSTSIHPAKDMRNTVG